MEHRRAANVSLRMDAEQWERFEAKFAVEPNTGCWLWIGSQLPRGYGQFCLHHGQSPGYAHRLSYEHFKGPIPSGLQIDHLCRQTCCCNPDHLEAVTQRTNVLRSSAMTARQAKRTHCPQGHPYYGTNLYISRRGSRCCRECNRVKCRERHHRRKTKAA